MKIYIVLLIIICIIILTKSHYSDDEQEIMKQVRTNYALLRVELKKRNFFPMLWKEDIVTGMREKSSEGVGYNVGKGYEIFICIKGGNINDIMHVFLHELAHNTVNEYDHSDTFWKNLDVIKNVAKDINIYKYTPTKQFCDGTISD